MIELKGYNNQIFPTFSELNNTLKNYYTSEEIDSQFITHVENSNLKFNEVDNKIAKCMEDIIAQGIKLYKVVFKSDDWTLNGITAGMSEVQNAWHFYRYNTLATTPTLTQANNAVYTAERYYLDEVVNYSPGIEYGNNYSAKCVTYLYCESARVLNFSFVSDDAGTVWLNGNQIATITSCAWTSQIACPFKEGWNELIVVYTEGTGEDGWDTSPKLYNNDNFLLMCADKGGFYEQEVIASPIGHNIPLSDNMVISNLMIIPTGNSIQDELINKELNLLNKGIITAKNQLLNLQTIGNCPNLDLECYFLAKETI